MHRFETEACSSLRWECPLGGGWMFNSGNALDVSFRAQREIPITTHS